MATEDITSPGATFSGESATLGQLSGRLTLVAGSGFCISGRSGDIRPGSPHGLFFQDTRFLSQLLIRVDGHPVETLATVPDGLHAAQVIGRVRLEGRHERSLLVFRRRTIDVGLRESIVFRNSSPAPVQATLELQLAADFAGLFEVKEGRVEQDRPGPIRADESGLDITSTDGEHRARVAFSQPFDLAADDAARFLAEVPARGEWELVLEVTASGDDDPPGPHGEAGEAFAEAVSEQRAHEWVRDTPRLTSDDERIVAAFGRSVSDLGALRIFDSRYGGRPVLAAGAPWFMTLFGRDSLIAGWMALLVDPPLALSTLEVLADLQGDDVDDRTEEEPGRILHEVRFGRSSLVAPGGGAVYYGTADATPLFVALVGEVARWGVDPQKVRQLLPHVDRALAWIDEWGDADGDGYVEYRQRRSGGLVNQGWKDSWDSISFADGRLARQPIALCEVQAYVYAAWTARACLADLFDDPAGARTWRSRASDLKGRFNEDFWIDERGWFALALDGAKTPVDALASNMGHALWAGIVDETRAPDVAARLVSDDLFSGWGVRTLARSMGRYDPLSYHNGSVWPHDTALAAAGLMRYGFVDEAHRLLDGLLSAADHYDRHLPELFTGLDRREAAVPVDYPTSSAPQAWAAGAPLLAVRSLLRLDPDLPNGRIHLAPALLPGTLEIRLEDVALGDRRATITARDGGVQVEGLPDRVEVVRSPRLGTEPARP